MSLYFLLLRRTNTFLKIHVNKMEFVIYPVFAEEVLPRIFLEQIGLPLDAYRRKIDVLHYPGTTASFLLRRSDVVTVHHRFGNSTNVHVATLRNMYYDIALKNNKELAGSLFHRKCMQRNWSNILDINLNG